MAVQRRSVAALAWLFAAVAVPVGVVVAQNGPPAGRPARPEPIAFDLGREWKDLGQLAEIVRTQSGVPGVALAVVRSGRIVEQAVSGVTSIEGGRPLTLEDRFEWGSVTKSVTGTVLMRMFADGRLRPETTVGEALPSVAMRPEYAQVTLAQLMRHEAGLPPYTLFDPPKVERMRAYRGTPSEKRLAFVSDVLGEPPVAPPGSKFEYSNADITLAAVIAERAGGRGWEDLVREYVFQPSGMTSGGFGAPANADRPDATRGHRRGPGGALVPVPFGTFAELSTVIAPAGNVHSSIGDFARYAQFHLAGLRAGVPPIPREWFEATHRADTSSLLTPNGGRYNYGWSIGPWAELGGEQTIWHNGSNGTFYAEVRLLPDRDLALLIMANSGGPIAFSSGPVLAEMANRYSGS